MFKCAVEEPVRRNEFLLLLDASTGSLVHADVHAPVCRYTFMPVALPGNLHDESLLLRAAAEQLAGSAFWISSWVKDQYPGVSPIGYTRRIRKATREGWEVLQRDDVAVAMRAVRWPVTDPWNPLDEIMTETILIAGLDVELAAIVDGPVWPSFAFRPRPRAFVPTVETFMWIARKHLLLSYPIHDDVGRRGLVVVTPNKLSMATINEQVPVEVADERSVFLQGYDET